MSIRKNPEADIDKKRPTYLLVSYVAVLALVLMAFEFKIFEVSLMDLGPVMAENIDEELIPITRQDQPPPPPPPPPVKPEQIEIVDDEEEVEDQPLFDSEIDEKTEITPIEIKEEEAAEPEIFVIVEDMPRFPGCEDKKGSNQEKDQCAFVKMQEFLHKNVKYPQKAIDANITGTVYVGFVVTEDGSIKDAKVLRNVGGGCDEEALRVVNAMPKWKPGKQRGKSVKVSYTLPVRFQLKQ